MFANDVPGWIHVNVDGAMTTSPPVLRYGQAMTSSTLYRTLASISLLGLVFGCSNPSQQPDIVMDGEDFFGGIVTSEKLPYFFCGCRLKG